MPLATGRLPALSPLGFDARQNAKILPSDYFRSMRPASLTLNSPAADLPRPLNPARSDRRLQNLSIGPDHSHRSGKVSTKPPNYSNRKDQQFIRLGGILASSKILAKGKIKLVNFENISIPL